MKTILKTVIALCLVAAMCFALVSCDSSLSPYFDEENERSADIIAELTDEFDDNSITAETDNSEDKEDSAENEKEEIIDAEEESDQSENKEDNIPGIENNFPKDKSSADVKDDDETADDSTISEENTDTDNGSATEDKKSLYDAIAELIEKKNASEDNTDFETKEDDVAADTGKTEEADETENNSGNIEINSIEDYDYGSYSLLAKYFEKIESVEKESLPFYLNQVTNKSAIDVYYVNGENMIPYIDIDTAVKLINDSDSSDGFSVELEKYSNEYMLTRDNGAIAFVDLDNNVIGFSDYNLFFVAPTAVNGLDMCCIPTNNIGIVEAFEKLQNSANELAAENEEASAAANDIAAETEKENTGVSDVVSADNTSDITAEPNEGDPAESLKDIPAVNIIKRTGIKYRRKSGLQINLDDYGIQLVENEGEVLIPLQTVSDIFLSPKYYNALYNGKSVIMAEAFSTQEGETRTPLGNLYAKTDFIEKTDALNQFNYDELCMALDYSYGLKEQHDIDTFDNYFIETGLARYFFTDNSADTLACLMQMSAVDFGDKHSAPYTNSPYGDTSKLEVPDQLAMLFDTSNFQKGIKDKDIVTEARALYYPDGIKGYEESGNTAYITFDSFTSESKDTFYTTAEPSDSMDDVLMLLVYSNERIHRENSPIENVVLDLSNNTGGDADVAFCVVAWFLGKGTVPLKDVITRSSGSTVYEFDANRDGVISSDDNVSDKNLFCITSANSFSCGNLVPAVFKNSRIVTVIGQTTGGGSCVVKPLSTADGTLFACSGSVEVSSEINGSYYGTDQGVTPNVYIRDFENVYNRKHLTKKINEMD